MKKLFEIYNKDNIKWCKWNENNYSTSIYLIKYSGALKILSNVHFQDNQIKLNNNSNFKYYVADYLLYFLCNTYTSTYPIFINNINLESTIHKNHETIHISGYNMAKMIRTNLFLDEWIQDKLKN